MFEELFRRLGIEAVNSGVCGDAWLEQPAGADLVSLNPSTGEPLLRIFLSSCAPIQVLESLLCPIVLALADLDVDRQPLPFLPLPLE